MSEIQKNFGPNGRGGVYIYEAERQLGEMEMAISGSNLIVYHTEVDQAEEGKGYAKKLLDAMADYARQHHYKVVPLCAYVHAQFKRNPEVYNDIWNKDREVE